MSQHKFYVSDKSENDYKDLPSEIGKTINDILRDTFYDALSKAEERIKKSKNQETK